jgi:DNA-binding response OmpR family regulator
MFNILIIEDEDLYRKFLLKILQKTYHCDTARSAEEARALLLHNSYDIVLYDLRLPGISGKDLVQWVRRDIDPDIVNIVITGFEDDWTPVQATEENIFYYLRKGDFQPDELMNIVHNAAAVRKMRIDERVSFSDQLATEGIVHAGKLAASIAHEINNPLQSLYLLIDTVKFKLSSADIAASCAKELKLMEKGLERIGTIVKQLLHLYRIDYDRTGPERVHIVLQRVLSFLRPIAKEQHTSIVLAGHKEIEHVSVLSNPLFYTVVNLCMKLLNDQYRALRIEPKIAHNSIVVSVTATLKDDLKLPQQADLVSRAILDSFSGNITVQKGQKGQRITLTFPLAGEGSAHATLKRTHV